MADPTEAALEATQPKPKPKPELKGRYTFNGTLGEYFDGETRLSVSDVLALLNAPHYIQAIIEAMKWAVRKMLKREDATHRRLKAVTAERDRAREAIDRVLSDVAIIGEDNAMNLAGHTVAMCKAVKADALRKGSAK